MPVTRDRLRLRVRCTGAVQGVGFRPTVYRIAMSLGLDGWVLNDPDGVSIEVEGPPEAVNAFVPKLWADLPPLARIDDLLYDEIPVVNESGFTVRESTAGSRRRALVPADAAICADCRHEMEDPMDRRSNYAFTTCTNCGPRFSLVHSLPYDRDQTSMACFELCPACRAEYEDPADRRFHAEPVCCPACGPELRLLDADGAARAVGDVALAEARTALVEGAVLAVKGLGGFQLACRADSEPAVRRLRERKRRPRKPFAVMARDLATARRLVRLTPADEGLMTSPRAPILIAPRLADAPIDSGVAPGIGDLGVMLPTTPLHLLLMADPQVATLVMTSGNRSEEPLCRTNREALERLATFADLFLVHDRNIVRRIDDSVVRSCPKGPVLVRRARGWVPDPLPLPVTCDEPILAVGGHLQATACVAVDGQAWPTQHIGDLESEPARAFHAEVIEGLEDFLQVRPQLIVADVHPDYPSRWHADRLAHQRTGRQIDVQHHLAHAGAVLGEHGRFPDIDETVIAIVLDGTGWGGDGTSWGGEWLRIGGNLRWERIAALHAIPLVGGDRAVHEPWRVAVAALAAAGHLDLVPRTPLAALVGADDVATVGRLATTGSWPQATGAGRLFEALGALLGLTAHNDWEGEAAAMAESCVGSHHDASPWSEIAISDGGDPPRLPSRALIVAAAQRLAEGVDPSRVAGEFHATFCHLAVELTMRATNDRPGPVVVGGGCLVNRLLRSGLTDGLGGAGYDVLLPTAVPPGDGGLAYGQAVVAAAAVARRVEPERTR